ncbi:MAG: hypothetical protein ABSF45_22440 [Terriglobia bacterium]
MLKNKPQSLAMFRKTKGLAVGRENHSKPHLIQIKGVRLNCGSRGEKIAGGKYEGKSGDVIENKRRKNVRKPVSRDVDETKQDKIALWRC